MTDKYNPDNPEGAWIRLRNDIAADDPDFAATQTPPSGTIDIGRKPQFESVGFRYFLEFYAAANPTVVIPGGTYRSTPIELVILPQLGVSVSYPTRVIQGSLSSGGPLPSLQVQLLSGMRFGTFSIRITSILFPATANRARVFVREV